MSSSSKGKRKKQHCKKLDIVTEAEINVLNSVIVSGLTQTELDEELEKHLATDDSVNRVVLIDDP